MGVFDSLSEGFLFRDTVALVLSVGGVIWITGKALAVNWRLAKNLDRKILIFSPNRDLTMEKELEVLARPGYFSVPKIVHDYQALNESDIREAGIVILVYAKGMDNFEKFIDIISRHEKPLIVYTLELGTMLDESHRRKLMSYKWHVVSSTPLRLVSDIYTTLATYQYGR